MIYRPRSSIAIGTMFCAFAGTDPALAQGGEDGAAPSELIIVTAQRREQSELEVPISLKALDGDLVSRVGIDDIRDLFYLDPSLDYQESVATAGSALRIRGVGSLGFANGVEQSVSTIIDGVVTGPSGSGLAALWDVERIEVLRGPQGTLFGKNVSAGAVNVISRRPGDEFEASGIFRYGVRYDTYRAEAAFGGPVTDNLGVRVSGFYLEENDGYIDNVVLNTTVNRKDRWGIRLVADYENGAFSSGLTLSYVETDDICCTRTFTGTDPVVVPETTILFTDLNGVTIEPDNRESISGVFDTEESQTVHLAFENAWTFADGHVLKSITGLRNWNQFDSTDADQLPIDLLDDTIANRDLRIFTEEIQLLSPDDQDLTYVLGLYYFNQRFEEEQFLAGGFLGGVSEVSRPVVRVNNAAIFGQATYRFTDRLQAFAGLRLLWEEIEAEGARTGNLPLPAFVNDQFNEESAEDVNWVGSFGVQYFHTDNNMIYASFDRGYKGHAIDTAIGGPFFDSMAVADPVLDPETVINVELGTKNVFFDGRLRANVVAFYSRFQDFQASAFDGNANSFVFRNAGVLEVTGIEADLAANPWEGAFVTVSASFVDGEFVEYEGAPCRVSDPAECLITGQDLSGEDLNGNARFRYAVTAQQDFPLFGDVDGFVSGQWSWRDDVVFDGDLDPGTTQEAYGVGNIYFGIRPAAGFEVIGFVENVADKTYAFRIVDAPLNTGAFASYLAPGRTFGVELRLRN